MSEFMISNKTVAVSVVACLIVVALAGFVGYNAGYSQGVQNKPWSQTNDPNAPGPENQTPATPEPTPETNSNTNTPVTVSGEPVNVAGKTTLSGTITEVTAQEFKLDVKTTSANPQNGQVTQKTTRYTVKLSQATQLKEQTSTVTVPPTGELPQIASFTKTIRASDLKTGQSVTASGTLNQTSLTATSVTVLTTVRK